MLIQEITEGTRCWKGYKKKGMKTMFGKRVPNCVKNEEAEIYSKTTLSDKEIAAAKKRVAARVAKRKEVEKNRQKNIKSGHNKKVQQLVHSEGKKILKQWEEQLLAKFPEMDGTWRLPQFNTSPVKIVKSAMDNGIETTGRLIGRRSINRNGISDEKLRSYYDRVIIPTSEKILLSLLPQIDFDKINAAYDDPSILDEDLRAWFGKGKKGGAGGGGWDRYNTKGERIGKCGDSKKGEGKPKCLSKSRAASLRAKGGKKAIGAAVSKKRRNDPNKNRKGKAKNVSNTVKSKK
jgi:hypothetical protein